MNEWYSEIIRCGRAPFGWWCSRTDIEHVVLGLGPCAARPSWWNVAGRLWSRG